MCVELRSKFHIAFSHIFNEPHLNVNGRLKHSQTQAHCTAEHHLGFFSVVKGQKRKQAICVIHICCFYHICGYYLRGL